MADISPSEFLKIQTDPSIPDKWKEKIKEVPTPKPEMIPKISEITHPKPSEETVSELSQIKTEELQPIPPTLIKEEEKIEVISTTQKQITPPILEASKQKSIPSIPDKKEEKLKEIFYFCKFCGMKLAQLEKFCQQCGTIIKHK